MGLSVGGVGHAVVQLVRRVDVQLEVGAHGRFNGRVEALLHLLAHVLVVVARAQLLVQLFVLFGRIDAFDGLRGSGGRRHRLAGLAPAESTDG